MVTHIIHRGLAKTNFKENTISSFNYCFKKKYGVETDLHCTKDNKIVCFHDFSLKSKFKVNKYIRKIYYDELFKISKKNKRSIPLLRELIKTSKNRHYLMLEIKPVFSRSNLLKLTKEVKALKKYGLISFKEKNLRDLYKINKRLNLGLLVPSTWTFSKIIKKAKLKFIKFLILEKKFLTTNKLNKVKKNIFYYTVKSKILFNKHKSKNLIFENL
jgi:glycerophosphoryl diester phosphodiesterase